MQYEIESWNGYLQKEIERMTSKNAVVIFSKNTCCMCHAIKRLMCGMGVDPTVYECDDHNLTWQHTLFSLLGNSSSSSLLVVFSGGKLVGSIDSIMVAHINDILVPLLKEAGALWL
ncbi:Glutaredoxin-C7 [Capsicum annuum]|uniref:Glutaredoxin-C7 n=1 Tax=Capsicum annuum TaxID=4072 RepID=A0A1U8GSK1_CAPAN|nr:Glutaredoxin-C7 [Capsicum annuum]KAF3615552.1 Glutaredoxin-C7 [Capsicum annuum]PHT81536.1 Glutaredoxin-C7 [Capsicum annuum]